MLKMQLQREQMLKLFVSLLGKVIVLHSLPIAHITIVDGNMRILPGMNGVSVWIEL